MIKRQILETMYQVHRFVFILACPKIGEGNGTPLQYSCLEDPMDGGAWWAAVHGVAQSWTRLKRLSSSSKAKGVSMTGIGQPKLKKNYRNIWA